MSLTLKSSSWYWKYLGWNWEDSVTTFWYVKSNFGSYFFIFEKCRVTQHRLYRDSLTLISLILRGISGKHVFLCNNNWVKKQPPVLISKNRCSSIFYKFHEKTPVKFEKFLRTPILKNTSERLLLWAVFFVRLSKCKAHVINHAWKPWWICSQL